MMEKRSGEEMLVSSTKRQSGFTALPRGIVVLRNLAENVPGRAPVPDRGQIHG